MHTGLYRFNRPPITIKFTPGIFQQMMDTLLNDIVFAIGYLNDSLIKSESLAQHAEHIKEVFEKIKQHGLKFSLDKCEFLKSKIKYLGQFIDAKSRKSDPSRSSAIKNMPNITNVVSLKSFLGLASYYGNFISNSSYTQFIIYFPGLLAGPSGIRVGWGIETNGRFETERPPTSVGPPSGGRTASSVPYVWH